MTASPENARNNGKTTLEFEKQTVGLAERYTLDVHEVRDAYRQKPESLSAHFNAMKDAWGGLRISAGFGALSVMMDMRNWRVGLAVAAVAAGFGIYNYHQLRKVGTAVGDEVKRHNRSEMAGPGK